MGKVKDSLIDVDKDGNTSEEGLKANFTHLAISMCHVPGEGWSLVKIHFDPVTNTVGKFEKKYTGEIRAYIEEKFKIETITDNIFNNCEKRHI